ncbi:hypothetical protein HNO89_000548 [Sporosarcina luteola]|nr:hypothetical protein [Sporosarcina luteola]
MKRKTGKYPIITDSNLTLQAIPFPGMLIIEIGRSPDLRRNGKPLLPMLLAQWTHVVFLIDYSDGFVLDSHQLPSSSQIAMKLLNEKPKSTTILF